MKWTDEPPKQPGWYWFRSAIRQGIMRVVERDGQLWIEDPSDGPGEQKLLSNRKARGFEWAGPLSEPTEQDN